jgi:GNAT superfamily N-acetyltransferase
MHSIEPIQPWALGPDYPRWTETLRDRTRVVVRPLTRKDADREREFIESLSPESLRFRFLGQVRHPSIELIQQLTELDYRRDVAFAAVVPDDADEKILGVSRYGTDKDGVSCECAVTVLDDWHHKGLGTLLMRHLIEVARARGILFMYSIDSAENVEMIDLARHLGFTCHRDPQDATQVVHRLVLSTTPA